MKFRFLIIALAFCFSGCKKVDVPQVVNALPESKFLLAYNVLVNEEKDDYDIWIVDPNTKESSNITNHPDVSWVYRGAGKKILFISDRDNCKRCYRLFEMDKTGEEVRLVFDEKLTDSWMDVRYRGQEIIVNSDITDQRFYIINRKGDIILTIYVGKQMASDPAFSPDGTHVVFRGADKKSKREEGFDEALYVISAMGKDRKRLTHYPESDTTAPWYAYKAGPPSWHPTENFISYTSFQNGKYSLYGVTPDGEKHWKLTDLPYDETYHDWSPDGRWLALELGDSTQSQYHIGLMNWETKELEILTDTIYKYQQSPAFIVVE